MTRNDFLMISDEIETVAVLSELPLFSSTVTIILQSPVPSSGESVTQSSSWDESTRFQCTFDSTEIDDDACGALNFNVSVDRSSAERTYFSHEDNWNAAKSARANGTIMANAFCDFFIMTRSYEDFDTAPKNDYICNMKKAIRSLSIIAAGIFFLASCDVEPDPKTYFDHYTAYLDYVGGTVEATVFSNGAWEATCETDGVVMTPDSGYGDGPITISLPENTDSVTTAVRIFATTTIGSSSYAAKLAVTLAARPFVVCEDNEFTISADGGIVRFFVNSNHPWSVVESKYDNGNLFDGTIVPSKWDKNGVSIEVTVPQNTTGMERSVTIKLQLESYSFASEILKINQSQ